MAKTEPEEAIRNKVEREVGLGASFGDKRRVKREPTKVLKACQGKRREGLLSRISIELTRESSIAVNTSIPLPNPEFFPIRAIEDRHVGLQPIAPVWSGSLPSERGL